MEKKLLSYCITCVISKITFILIRYNIKYTFKINVRQQQKCKFTKNRQVSVQVTGLRDFSNYQEVRVKVPNKTKFYANIFKLCTNVNKGPQNIQYMKNCLSKHNVNYTTKNERVGHGTSYDVCHAIICIKYLNPKFNSNFSLKWLRYTWPFIHS